MTRFEFQRVNDLVRVAALATSLLIVLTLCLSLTARAQETAAEGEEQEMVDAVLEGQVVDALGIEVEGVTVKLFRDSFFVIESTTDLEGSYKLDFSYDPALDKSLVVWFLPQETELIPEILVLRESFQSKELKLLSPCLPRIELGGQMSYNVELLDEKAKLESLSESECFKKES